MTRFLPLWLRAFSRRVFQVSAAKISLAVLILFIIPGAIAYAGFFSLFNDIFSSDSLSPSHALNSQNVSLLAAASPFTGGPDASYESNDALGVVGDAALYAESGPQGASADVDHEGSTGHIFTYVVRTGDSYSSIADMFGVSVNTILWANDLSRGTPLKVGMELVILPISGVRYTVAKGDTLSTIAKKYKGDVDEIAQYNGLAVDTALSVGDVVIIPDGEVPAPVPSATRVVSATSKLRNTGGPSYSGYYTAPLASYRKTQGLHGYNGVDLASYLGAPVMAAAAGEVIIAKQGGYNGGYGNYVVIKHGNGTQTLYGHLQSVNVSVGDTVVQGQQIGRMGNTGRSTGPHLHFEVRGAKNPF